MTDCCLVFEDKPNAGRRGFVLGGAKITTSDSLEILKFLVSMNGNLGTDRPISKA